MIVKQTGWVWVIGKAMRWKERGEKIIQISEDGMEIKSQ